MEANDLVQSKNFLKRIISESTSPEDFIHSCLTGNYSIKPGELKGEICDWVLNYLEQRNCPHQLAIFLAVSVAAQISASVNAPVFEDSVNELYPSFSALTLQKKTFICLLNLVSNFLEDTSKIMAYDFKTALPYAASTFAIRNKRRKMEDKHVVIHDLNSLLNLEKSPLHSYYAVFDGHGGIDVANYAAAHLHENIAQHPDFLSDTVKAIKEAYKLTDACICEKSVHEGLKGGCTAVCALFREKTLYLSWCGDSQGILIKRGKSQVLSDPHKPERIDEKTRIEELGGFVYHVGTWRVNGALAVSRSLGDHEFKPFVSSEPDVNVVDLDGSEDFLVLACDGLWDSMTPEEVTSMLYKKILDQPDDNFSANSLAEKLVHTSKLQGSEDNISVVVIFLRDVSKIREDAELDTALYMNGKIDKPNNSVDQNILEIENHTAERPTDLQFPNLSTEQSISNNFEHGLATSLPPEATALSELPTPPIDDIVPTREFSELNYAEQMEQLQSHLEAKGFQGTSFGKLPPEGLEDSSQKDTIEKSNDAADYYTTEVSSHTVFPIELSVRDATPEKAAIDMASHIINTTLETAIEKIQLVKNSDIISSNLNPDAQPFVMKNFSDQSSPSLNIDTTTTVNIFDSPLQQNLNASDVDITFIHNKGSDLTNLQESSMINDQSVLVDNMKACSLNDENYSECLPKTDIDANKLSGQLNLESSIEQTEIIDTSAIENSEFLEVNITEQQKIIKEHVIEQVDLKIDTTEKRDIEDFNTVEQPEIGIFNIVEQEEFKVSANKQLDVEASTFKHSEVEVCISKQSEIKEVSNTKLPEIIKISATEQSQQLLQQCLEKHLPHSSWSTEQSVHDFEQENNVGIQKTEQLIVVQSEASLCEPILVETATDAENNSNIKSDIISDQNLILKNYNETLENNKEQIYSVDNNYHGDHQIKVASGDTFLKDTNALDLESSVENELVMDTPKVVPENIESPNISKQVISSDSLLPKEIQDELLKITENPPSENVTDDCQTGAVAVDLKTIPDGVPEADGVSEDIDSDSEKDGGWSYVKAGENAVSKSSGPKESEVKAKKTIEDKVAATSAKGKKELSKPIKDATSIVKSKAPAILDKAKKLPLEKKILEARNTSTLKSVVKSTKSIAINQKKPPVKTTDKTLPPKSDSTKPAVASKSVFKMPTTVKSAATTTKPNQARVTAGSYARPSRPTNVIVKDKTSEAVPRTGIALTKTKPLSVTTTTSKVTTKSSGTLVKVKPSSIAATASGEAGKSTSVPAVKVRSSHVTATTSGIGAKSAVSSVKAKPSGFAVTTSTDKKKPLKPAVITTVKSSQPIRVPPPTTLKSTKDEKSDPNKQALKTKPVSSVTRPVQKSPLFSSTPKPNPMKSTPGKVSSAKQTTNVRPIPMKLHVGLKPPKTGSKLDMSVKPKKVEVENKASELSVELETKDAESNPSKVVDEETEEKFAVEANTEKIDSELTPNDAPATENKQNETNIKPPDNVAA